MTVYLDHAATTPVRDEVMAAMAPFFGPRFGNPSSVHRWGREARVALDEARERLAVCLGAHSDELCFTSGGTEGDNIAILGVARALRAVETRWIADGFPGAVPDVLLDQAVADVMNLNAASADRGRA